MSANASEESSEEQTNNEGKLFLYPADRSPSIFLWPVYGFQHALLIVMGSISVGIVLADKIGAGDLPEVRSKLISLSIFTSGVATLMQVMLGSRLPVMQGTFGLYVVVIAAIFNNPSWSDESLRARLGVNETDTPLWMIRLREIQGGLILASGTHFLLAVSGAVGFFLRFVGPMTIAPILVMMGISLAQLMVPLCEQHWGIAALSLALLLLFSLYLVHIKMPLPAYSRSKGCHVTRYPLFQLNPFVLAVGLSWTFCHVLTVTDVFPKNETIQGYLARTDIRLEAVAATDWFFFPYPFHFGPPTVSVSGYVGMLVITIVLIVQSPGNYYATAEILQVPRPPAHAINRGMAIDGISGCIGGMVGGVLSSVAYLQNLGITVVTRVASRTIFATAGVILIFMGVIGKFGVVLTLIPDAVIGGVNLNSFGMLVAFGISVYQTVDLSSSRNIVVIGTSLILGIIIPPWITDHAASINTGSAELDGVIVLLMSSSLFVSGLVGCVLDNTVKGSLKERGMSRDRQSSNTCDLYNLPLINGCFEKLRCCSFVPVSPTYEEPTCRLCSCKCRMSDKNDRDENELRRFPHEPLNR